VTHLNLVVVGQRAQHNHSPADHRLARPETSISRVFAMRTPPSRATTVGLAVILRYLKHQPARRISLAEGPSVVGDLGLARSPGAV
jgi:hypothetical protein